MSRAQRNFFNLWADTVALGAEAQIVVGLRLAKLAAGGPKASAECSRMFTEKMQAAIETQQHLVANVLAGKSGAAHRDTVRLYRRRVRANRKRLSKPR